MMMIPNNNRLTSSLQFQFTEFLNVYYPIESMFTMQLFNNFVYYCCTFAGLYFDQADSMLKSMYCHQM